MSCELIALHLLQRAEKEGVDDMTQMKLQKLLYYVQGYHLGLHGAKAFSAPIKAYNHGPVVSSFYGFIRQNVAATRVPVSSIALCAALGMASVESLDANLLNVADTVFDELGTKSAYELRKMTHNESPWINHKLELFSEKADGKEITEMELIEYFSPFMTERYLATVVADAVEIDESELIAVPQEVNTAEEFLAWMKAC